MQSLMLLVSTNMISVGNVALLLAATSLVRLIGYILGCRKLVLKRLRINKYYISCVRLNYCQRLRNELV